MTDPAHTSFDATLFDGETAAATPARVTFQTDGVAITPSEGPTQLWAYATSRRLDSAAGTVRLAPDGASMARLAIADPDGHALAALRGAAPGRFTATAGARRTVILALGLAAGAAAVIGLGMVAIPVVAGPLARATPPQVEAGLGDWYADNLTRLWPPCAPEDDAIRDGADQALTQLSARITAVANPALPITITLVDAGFPNAFALPGGRVLVTEELLALMDGPDELAGVLAHEIAHVERRHVMAAMIREFGAAILVDAVVSGGSGAGRELILAGRELNAFGHTRVAEREADDLAIEYLAAADIDPDGLARFFDTIAELSDEDAPAAADWLRNLARTHPETKERAQRVRDAMADRPADAPPFQPSMDAEAWATVKRACGLPGNLDPDAQDAEAAAAPDDAPSPSPTPDATPPSADAGDEPAPE